MSKKSAVYWLNRLILDFGVTDARRVSLGGRMGYAIKVGERMLLNTDDILDFLKSRA